MLTLESVISELPENISVIFSQRKDMESIGIRVIKWGNHAVVDSEMSLLVSLTEIDLAINHSPLAFSTWKIIRALTDNSKEA